VAVPLTLPTPPTTAEGTVAAGLSGVGVALPETVVTNADWERVLDTTDEWITSRTGIRERRRAAPDETTSDLAGRAARAALADAGLEPREIGAVIVATTTPDHVIPQTAPTVSAGLGLEVPAFDVGAGCTGFVYGLAVAGTLAACGLAERVLLIGAEVLTRFVDPSDRETAVLFGDGAGATVVTAGTGALGPFDLGSDGGLRDLLVVPAGGARDATSPETVAGGAHRLRMNGREVYRHAVSRMSASSLAVLGDAGLAAADVDILVGHQANARILDAVARRLGIPEERAFLAIARYGNTSAASIPIALAEAREQGRLEDGMRVLLTAFGAGLTWGSCLLRWGEVERV
jgi:3-oxoacyl-[acyl-carrier-protein] synthase III